MEEKSKVIHISHPRSKYIYLVTNETQMVVESAHYNLLDAKKEFEEYSKHNPQEMFMVVETPIN